jgi:hypothetical protein
MPSVNDTIAHALSSSQMLLQRYTEDFTPEEYLKRVTPDSNCAAWIIGHLTLTDRRALGALGATDLPALPQGYEQRFGRTENAPQASDFGDVKILMPLFHQHRQRLIETVHRATAEQLEKPVQTPRPMFKTAGEMAHFMALHAATHAGQITMIRRALGRPIMI